MWAREDKIITINAAPNELRGVADKIERKLRDDITKSGTHFESLPTKGDVTIRFVYLKP